VPISENSKGYNSFHGIFLYLILLDVQPNKPGGLLSFPGEGLLSLGFSSRNEREALVVDLTDALLPSRYFFGASTSTHANPSEPQKT
jgi:hypothetical protein